MSNSSAIPTDLAERFGDAISVAADGAWELTLGPDALRDALVYLGQEREPAFDYLIDLFGVDYGEELEVVYQVASAMGPEVVRVRARLPRRGPSVHTVTDIWAGASWAEREMMEMYGIAVEDLADTRHLLLPDDWKGFPLRKDYKYPDDHPWLSRDPLHEDPAKYIAEHPVEE